MTDAQVVQNYLRSLGRFGVKPGLERIAYLLEGLGQPHTAFKVVHVAGSNGKGSIASFVAAGLQRSGLRTGLYTSPHLVTYNERIRVNGVTISDAALRGLVDRIAPLSEGIDATLGSPTEFDVGTAMAFAHFAAEQVDVAVIETGMGGRWDSTNVVDPVLSIITPITLDHAEILGATMAEIAGEKAGIVKHSRPVLVAPQAPEVRDVLVQRAKERQAPLWEVWSQSDAPAQSGCQTVTYVPLAWGRSGGEVRLQYPDGTQTDYQVGMLGFHQLQNAAVGATALYALTRLGLPIAEGAIRRAVAETQVAGRLEVVQRTPDVVLDGAHNELGAEQLALALAHLYPKRPLTLVCGISQDKPAEAMLRALAPLAPSIVATQAAASRLGCWSATALADMARGLGYKQAEAIPLAPQALQHARAMASHDGVICVMGSLYLVGEIRGMLGSAHELVGTPLPPSDSSGQPAL